MPAKTPIRFSLRDFFSKTDNPFWKGLAFSPGFTFQAQEINMDDFNSEVTITSQKKRAFQKNQCLDICWAHKKTGLEAEMRYSLFSDTNVLEIEGTLYNRGKRTVGGVRGPFSLFLTMDITGMGVPRMTTVYGGASTQGSYPPQSYLVTETDGLRSLIGGGKDGRSTETEMPYVFVTNSQETYGFFCALEWPCRWIMTSSSRTVGSRHHITVLAHVAYTGFDLKPGASINMPKANVGFFKGNAVAGSNALRRHIVRHVRRPIKGASKLPPVFYNHYYGLYSDWTVKEQMKEAKAYAELGVEYFIVDADWYKGGFRKGNGNWEFDDRKRFPRGMAVFADYVRSLGMKFGSWIEIEWAMKGSHWVKHHPEWFYRAQGERNFFYGTKKYDDVLLRLDDEKIRSQVADFLEQWVNKYGIEWVRWDFNNAPGPFWDANEGPNEWGRLHLAYGHGLLALLDEFMARCPQVHIEACAGGGYRMDLGTLRRAHSAWMNDNSHTFNTIRRFQAGLNRVLPGNYGNSAFLWATHPRQREQSLSSLRRNGYAPAILRSRMAGSLGFAEQSRLYTPAVKRYLKKEIDAYKTQRRFLMEDYYPLFSPQRLSDYDGWQFHDPATEEGFFMVFRCESPGSQTEVELPGLSRSLAYELTDMDTGRKKKLVGGRNIQIQVPESNGVCWCRYHAK